MKKARKILPVDPVFAIGIRLKTPAGKQFLEETIGHVEARYGMAAAEALLAAVRNEDVAKAAEFAGLVLGEFRYSVVNSDYSGASINRKDAMFTSRRISADGVDPLVALIIGVTAEEIRDRGNLAWGPNLKGRSSMPETRAYDPIAASVVRLGMPGGDEFFTDNLDFMRERHGNDITDALRAAVTENDLGKAEEFASLVVEGFSYKVIRNDGEVAEISYTAPGDIEGRAAHHRFPGNESDPLVLAVIHASEGIWSKARVRAKVDAEIAAEEAAARQP
jgi:hypothetical protein